MEHPSPVEHAQIRFSTDILRRLGEELNPSPDQGILELVKNAYDADARNCMVELLDTQRPGGTIRVSDDGHGMDSNGIKNGWLVLGRSTKERSRRTTLGRIPAGSKGLGRLAALRMGKVAELRSCPSSEPRSCYGLKLEWEKFDRATLIGDVDLTVKRQPRKDGSTGGTLIEVSALKESIGRREAKKLARGLILLADPFADDPQAFKPRLDAPEFRDLEELVSRRYFDDAEYHLHAELDDTGNSSATVVDWRGEVLFAADHKELSAGRGGRAYQAPPSAFDFWAFILNASTFSTRSTTLGEVREWLQEFGGVHLYENGLRVGPYGNPGNDWLDINLARARSPEERPSTNTSIGRVSVFDQEGDLIQKTDRSGFIETEAFFELRSFCQDALEWMARRRVELAEKRRAKARASAPKATEKRKETVDEAIDQVKGVQREKLRKAFGRYEKAREKEVTGLRSEVQLYRTLSTAGITAVTFAHESRGNPVKVITQAIQAIERRGRKALGGDYPTILQKPVDTIKRGIDALAVLGTATLRLVAHEKRRPGRVEVHTVIREVLETFRPFLEGRDVVVETELAGGEPFLRASEAALESIVTNLLNNSLTAFERSHTDSRKVVIQTQLEGEVVFLTVGDNGPGIEGVNVKDIWLPGVTTQPNGTGLGLTIVKDAVTDIGGSTTAVAHGRFGGAEITIELPILGS